MKPAQWIIVTVAAAALVVLFVVLKPTADPSPAATSSPSMAMDPSSPMPGMDHTTEDTGGDPSTMDAAEWSFIVKKGVVEGPDAVQVQAGRMVHLTVTSDVAAIIHLHGYEIMQNIGAGKTTSITVQADAPGRFEFALHADAYPNVHLAELEVTP